MVSIVVFQTIDGGSIPPTRSIWLCGEEVNTSGFHPDIPGFESLQSHQIWYITRKSFIYNIDNEKGYEGTIDI